MATLETLVVEKPDPRKLDPARWWMALQRIVPRAMTPSAAKLGSRAPRGKKGRLRRFSVRAKPISQGLVQGVQAEIGSPARHAHLVAFGHRIIPRGPSRKRLSITTVRISKRTGRQVVSVREGFDPTARQRLRERRARGAIGFVPGHPFEDTVWREDQAQIVRLIEKLLAQEVARAV